ncbi:MAG: hypothetical protein B6U65_01325 [Candidatus Wolframiiraptor sp. EX4484-121]|nr:MAG: hypothetical protein B6U65_01325 [Candidatus Wolframiiraptor sp. EX4484-121]
MGTSVRISVPEAAWADSRERSLEFPPGWRVKVYPMKGYGAKPIDRKDVVRALRNPIGSKPLRRLAEGKEEAVIVFDDHTRPTRAGPIAEAILEELRLSGIGRDHVRLIAATGAHGAMDRVDFSKKLGERILEEYPVYNHNPFHGCERIGETSRGTPIEVNGEYLSCDLKIAIGCIVPHPMFGFGGGCKIMLPGLASIDAISHNHGTVGGYVGGGRPHRSTGWGRVRGNVLLEDAEEFAKASHLDFKIDVHVNGFNDTVAVFCGDVVEEFRRGVEEGREAYSSEIPENYDVVVLNTSAKANEATLALSAWAPYIRRESVVVLVANDPRGQVTHYLYGKFGKRLGGVLPYPLRPPRRFRKLIVYSEHPEVDPQLPIAPGEEVEVIRSWEEVLEEISSSLGRGDVRVAIIPNADIQCPREALSQA